MVRRDPEDQTPLTNYTLLEARTIPCAGRCTVPQVSFFDAPPLNQVSSAATVGAKLSGGLLARDERGRPVASMLRPARACLHAHAEHSILPTEILSRVVYARQLHQRGSCKYELSQPLRHALAAISVSGSVAAGLAASWCPLPTARCQTPFEAAGNRRAVQLAVGTCYLRLS